MSILNSDANAHIKLASIPGKTLMRLQRMLTEWKSRLLKERQVAEKSIKEQREKEVDLIDIANQEIDLTNSLALNIERDELLVSQIDKALERINQGTYGYCMQTGEPIGLKRLEAWPIATLCLEEQMQKERSNYKYR